MSARANWKGYIRFGEVSCPVALYTAASSSERIAFNTLNRKTGNRVRCEFIDSETGDAVAAAIPESDETLTVDAFIPCVRPDRHHLFRQVRRPTGWERRRLFFFAMA